MNNQPTEKSFPLKSYSPQQLCELYQITRKTFLKWIKPFREEIGPRIGHFYTVKQVEVIIKKLGEPGNFIAE